MEIIKYRWPRGQSRVRGNEVEVYIDMYQGGNTRKEIILGSRGMWASARTTEEASGDCDSRVGGEATPTPTAPTGWLWIVGNDRRCRQDGCMIILDGSATPK